MNNEAPFAISSPGDLIRACSRHKGKAGGFVLAVGLVTLAIILWFPRSYRSEAQLFVRVGRESVGLDPTATTGKTVQMLESREREINSAVAMLASRAMAEKVVDQLSAAVVLGKEKPASVQQASASSFPITLGTVVAGVDPIDDREKAIIKVQKSLQVESPRSTSVIRVSYYDKTPARAQQVVSALVQAHMEEHVRINRTTGSHEFFEDQAELMEVRWKEASEKLRETKNEFGLVSIDIQRSLLEKEVSKLEAQFVETATAKVAAEARVEKLSSLKETTPARIVVEEEAGFANEALDRMREALYGLEIRERELLTKFTDEHPEVVAIRDQVRQAREILSEQDDHRTHSTTAANPARQKLDLDLIAAQADASALAASSAKLSEELGRIQQKVERLNDNDVLITELEKDVEVEKRNYLSHLEKLEETRIDRALDNDRISNVNVIQPASLEMKPASPRKGLVAAAGIAFASLGSIVIVVLGEQFDPSSRTADRVERTP